MAVVKAIIADKYITIRFPKGYVYMLEKEDYDNFRKILAEKGFKKVGEYSYSFECSDSEEVMDIIHDLKRHIGIIVREFVIK